MVPVFDGHNDALTTDDAALLATGRPGGHIDIPRMRAGGMRGGIFAVFSPSSRERRRPVPRTDGVTEFEFASAVAQPRAAAFATVAAGRLCALERAGHVRIARSIADIDAACDGDGPPATVLHVEGAEAIDTGLEALDFWYSAGLRSLGPVWSRPNAFGEGVPFAFPSSPDTGPGLTDAGRALVGRCADRGILVDLSHLNESGFWDVARLDVGALVSSHSGAHALAPHSRNLTDRQLDAIAASGGLVGVVFAVPFLRSDFVDESDTPLDVIVAHARYIADRIGVQHVALGSDFDGAPIPATLGDVTGLPRLSRRLPRRVHQGEIADIAWHNWRRVLAAWWGD